MLLHDFLIDSAKRFADKESLVFEGKRFTYGKIRQKAAGLAAYLADKCLVKGDRAAVYLENGPETVISIFGILEAGGCFVIINPTIKANKLKHILANSGVAFIITSANKKNLMNEVFSEMDKIPSVIYCGGDNTDENSFEGITDSGKHPPSRLIIDNDLAAIIYTSGSTGEAKGVTMTHRNMVSAATSITTYLENIESDRILNLLPFSFDYGLYQLLMTFKFGGTLVLERGFGFPFQVIELIKKEKITGLPFVPTMFAIILQMQNLEKHQLTSVRYITNTAAALPPAYIPRIRKVFPNARLFSMYGLTECKRVSYLPPEILDKKPESVGIPMPNLEVWIVDDNGRKLPAGETGELVIRGASVMRGYWNDPEATAKVLHDSIYPWEKLLYSGDLFRTDEDGFLYFVGRRDDIIKSRGERISPGEIENVLYEMEDILNVRISGVPHEILGQAIKAEIVVKDGRTISEKDVMIFCKRHLEDLMIPHIVEFVKSLPVSASGKIKRKD